MNILPQFSLGINNAFWFSLIFWITNLIILKIFPTHYKKRVLKMPELNGIGQKIIAGFNFFLFQGLIVIVIFLPLLIQTSYFAFGLVIFILFFFGYVKALIDYATSDPAKPVTKGIYKLSRNPQQITTIFMWVGLGLMTNCSLITMLCLLQLFTVYPTFKAQETFCLEKYGEDYEVYMKLTARYFLFF